MMRQIITIDKDKCNGCELCVQACHEGAIGMVDGKAALLRDDYCDGLGDCLPACPTGAISFEQREAGAYDEAAVARNMAKNRAGNANAGKSSEPATGCEICDSHVESFIGNWPLQIRLAPIKAGYFDGAKLLVSADCAAYAYGNFHNDYMKNKVTLIGCPKLDNTDYSAKLTEILKANDIKSVTVVRMEVPCCGGIEFAVKQALTASGKMIPWQVVTISTDGQILD